MREDALKTSIIRSSSLVISFFLVGHILNYGLHLVANRLLPASGFGIFYTSVTAINILLSVLSVPLLLLMKHFAVVVNGSGPSGLRAEFDRLARRMLRPALIALALGVVLTAVASVSDRFDRPAILLLVLIVAAGEFAMEALRSSLQAGRWFLCFGWLWVLWMGIRLALASMGLLLTGTVWAALAGMIVAIVISFTIGYRMLADRCGPSQLNTTVGAALNMEGLPGFALGMAAFTLIMHGDTLRAYLGLTPDMLGQYSGSSLPAKAMVIAIMPVVQILLPIAVGEHAETVRKKAFLKALGFSSALVIGAWLTGWLGQDLVCGSSGLLHYCDNGIMLRLLAAALPLVILRILLVVDLARGHRGMGVLLLPGLVGLAFLPTSSPGAIANAFLVLVCAQLIIYAIGSKLIKLSKNK